MLSKRVEARIGQLLPQDWRDQEATKIYQKLDDASDKLQSLKKANPKEFPGLKFHRSSLYNTVSVDVDVNCSGIPFCLGKMLEDLGMGGDNYAQVEVLLAGGDKAFGIKDGFAIRIQQRESVPRQGVKSQYANFGKHANLGKLGIAFSSRGQCEVFPADERSYDLPLNEGEAGTVFQGRLERARKYYQGKLAPEPGSARPHPYMAKVMTETVHWLIDVVRQNRIS